MSRTMPHRLLHEELKTSQDSDGDAGRGLKKLQDLPKPAAIRVSTAKARAGAAFKAAFGDEGAKRFGHEGYMSALASGEQVPDYLARIVDNDEARRRFALSLLKDDPHVKVRLTVEVEWDGQDI